MLYFIGALMGYLIGINSLYVRAAQRDIGAMLVDPTARLLLSLGGLGGWFCVLPAAYFFGSSDENGFMQGLLFCLAALGGAAFSGLIRIPGLSQLLAILTIVLNVGLVVLVFILTR